jgi:secondary thiamine-phosphate synthase enzyme
LRTPNREEDSKTMRQPIERSWEYNLAAEFGHRNVTAEVESLVADSGVHTGIAVVQTVGSTVGVTTIEYENGALSDLERALEVLAPTAGHYEHNARWGDGNGFSHIRSALVRTSVTVPVLKGELALGTWQQIVVINFDNRKRSRRVVAVVVGA